ncbi:MAG: metallophosphoesterase family protein [Clostridia bacterium]|nr:metallophosphoesterase family protein [Clostridia bacterium]
MDPVAVTPAGLVPALRTLALGEGPQGLRALFASDIHLRRNMDPDRLLAPLMKARADLVLLGGDYADDRRQALRLFEALRQLRPALGIYCCIGNNDREAFGTPEALARAVDRFGGRLLVNESVSVGSLAIGGLDEYKHGQPRYEGLFRDRGAYRILLSHYPILPKAEGDALPELMLAGHTHGGQFNLLGLTPYAVLFEGRKKRPALISGTARFGHMTLLVSKGIGMSRLPLRIGVEPEAHLLLFGA